MAKIKNLSRGPRTINVADGPADKDGKVPTRIVTLMPFEERDDLDFVNADDPVLRAMIDSGELSLDGSGDKLTEANNREAELETKLREARAEISSLRDEINEARFANDPARLRDLELAADAGRRFADAPGDKHGGSFGLRATQEASGVSLDDTGGDERPRNDRPDTAGSRAEAERSRQGGGVERAAPNASQVNQEVAKRGPGRPPKEDK